MPRSDALDARTCSLADCKWCPLLTDSSRALRRLAAIDVAAHAYHEAPTYDDQSKALDALLAVLKTETE